MRSRPASLFAVALPLLLSACIVFVGPDDPVLERDLVAARARWNERGLSDYTVVARALCFCVQGGQPMRVVVRRGQVVSVTSLATGMPVDSTLRSVYRTVEELFDLLDDASRRRAHRIDAEYDPMLGYPTRFWIDYSEMIADEEFGYEITALSPG